MNAKRARQILRCVGPHWEEPETRDLREALAEAAKSPELAAAYRNQAAFDRAAGAAMHFEVPVGVAASLAGYGDKFSERRPGFHLSIHSPAVLAVGASFLVLIALVAWTFVGNAGGFSGMREVTELALAGSEADVNQFDPLQVKASTLGDWFVLEGFDGFRVPDELADVEAVGVRLYSHEGELVAAVAVPLLDRKAFFYSFEAHPFGVSVTPEGAWRVVAFGPNDENVLAICEVGSKAFVVTFRGTQAEMEGVLAGEGGG
jgi:hypothetical protein